MIVKKLFISHFRGIREASLYFNTHTLLVGQNNVGKSTICEALDLVMGPDRLYRNPPIDEYDFFNGEYFPNGENIPEIKIEVILIDLSEELQSVFRAHLEFWNLETNELLVENEIDQIDSEKVMPCLRILFKGWYDLEEDEFLAKTFYSHSPNEEENKLTEVYKSKKRLFGFLYLRAIRTGNRALSLEKGTLLDLLLKVGEIRPKFWEDTREKLLNLNPPLDSSIGSLRNVLDNIEERIAQYITLPKNKKSTTLHVSMLTREHLRKTLAFFMSSSAGQSPVPFQRLGTGTLSTLVFALLSAIAELKRENIIFAMEEPEIAIPPHTQRRIIDYLLKNTTQSFVTSHSPYVIEKFDPTQIKILRKDENLNIESVDINYDSGIKPKSYRRKIRHSIAEAILGNAVIIGEGLTEQEVLQTSAAILEEQEGKYPLDLSGVTIFDADGDSKVVEYGKFFKSIGLKTYAFFDKLERTEDQIKEIEETFDFYKEIDQSAIEKLLSEEVPVDIQWDFLRELSDNGEFNNGPFIPDVKPSDVDVQTYALNALRQKKGERRSSDLIAKCNSETLPNTIKKFLDKVYSDFPEPEEVSPINFNDNDNDLETSEEE